MTVQLLQSTASQEIPLGHFIDETDGISALTGLTIVAADIQVWKAGASALVNKNSGGATHMAGGVYVATLDATDTDTVGPLVLFVHPAGALPVRLECHVFATAPETRLAAIETDTQDLQARTPAALVGGRMDSSTGAMAANVLTAAATAADFSTEVNTAPLAAIATAQTSIDDLPTNAELTAALATTDDAVLAQVALVKEKTDALPADPADQSLLIDATNAILARLGAPAGASMSADIAAVLTSVGLRLLTTAYTAPLDAAATRDAVGLSAANLETLLAATQTATNAVKAKTDSLAFTSGRVHSDIKAVAGSTIGENGSGATNWGAV